MKSLTKTQQEIVNSIVKEFETFNAPINESDPNDLIAFINNALEEKQGFIDEIKITNKAYDKANENQVLEYVNQMNGVLNVFGYDCELLEPSRSGFSRDYALYFQVKITWIGHKKDNGLVEYTDIFFYANHVIEENTPYLADASIRIYKKYLREDKIDSLDDLLKYVADLIINKKKSLIK